MECPTHLPSDCPCCLWWSERHHEMERQRDNFQASVKDLAGQCLELQQQRDELLAAMREVYKESMLDDPSFKVMHRTMERVLPEEQGRWTKSRGE